MRTRLGQILRVVSLAIMSFGFATGDASAGWVPVNDTDSTDSATNPGHPQNQNPATVAAYLQDLLNLTAAPALQSVSSTYSSGVISGLGNPQSSGTYLLALHFGNSNDTWEHEGPFNVFFYCQSDCGSIRLESAGGLGNYRLYSTAQTIVQPGTTSTSQFVGPLAIPEPATLALLGLGILGLGFARFKRKPDIRHHH